MNVIAHLFRTVNIKIYLAIILAVGAFARLVFITKADIWHDEGYTMMISQFNAGEIIERTARDVHPPLYYLATHYWQFIFGTSELATRSLSAACGLVTIVFVYLIMRRLFTEGTARLAALFVAIGPFAVRYSDEARMYGMAAMLVVIATYLMVRIAGTKNASYKLWLAYALVIAAGLYTHYYTLFIIPAHSIYLAWSRGGIKPTLGDKKWWLAHLLAAAAFVPWLPSAFAQMTRVGAGFWIPPVNAETVPNTFMQFLAFIPSWGYSGWIAGILITLFVIGVVRTFIANKRLRPGLVLLAGWLILPLAIVMLVSIARPVYYDRYFTYCAIALYMLLAVIIVHYPLMRKYKLLQAVTVTMLIATLVYGIAWVGNQATHRMGAIGSYVTTQYLPGDTIVSGELYTYFDFSYYNHTGQPTLLHSKNTLSGYGETSLLYDRQNILRVSSLNDIKNTERVWLVGKTGEHDYYSSTPANWHLTQQLQAGDSEVRLYTISSEE